jgi:hypothetical protein
MTYSDPNVLDCKGMSFACRTLVLLEDDRSAVGDHVASMPLASYLATPDN